MPRPGSTPLLRRLGLPVCASLVAHAVLIIGVGLLLVRSGRTSDDDPVRARLRVSLASEVVESPVLRPEPLAPERSPVDEPIPDPMDPSPDVVPTLPPQPPAEEEDLLLEPSAEQPERVPLLPTYEVPLEAVRPRTPPPAPPPPRARLTMPVPAPQPTVVRRPARRALRVLHQPDPRRWYPEEARRRGIEGTAIIRITIDARGVVTDAQVKRSSGSALLDAQAMRVGFAYRFAAGSPGAADLPVRFRLEG